MEQLTIATEHSISQPEQEALDFFMDQAELARAGTLGAMEVYARLHRMQKMLSELKDEINDQALDERERYPKGEDVERCGYTISKSSRTNFSYKHDEDWQSYNEAKKARQEQMKKAFKQSEKGQALHDPATGEVIPPAEVTFSTFLTLREV